MKTSYQLGIVLALLFTTLAGSAQSRSYRIYDQYANREGITFLAFSKSMIDAVNMNIDEENKKVTGDLMEIRVLFSNREKNKNHGSLAKSISEKLNTLDYRKIRPDDAKDDDNVEFWIDPTGPWAGQLSFSIPTAQWNPQGMGTSVAELAKCYPEVWRIVSRYTVAA